MFAYTYAKDSSIFISSRHIIANSIMYTAYFRYFKLIYGYECTRSENEYGDCMIKSVSSNSIVCY